MLLVVAASRHIYIDTSISSEVFSRDERATSDACMHDAAI